MIRGLARAARRRLKRQRRTAGVVLILVSLIDIFVNLVIYLMYSSSGVEALPNPQTIALPESYATQKPKEAHVVTLTKDELIFGEKRLLSVAEVEAHASPILEPLRAELDTLATRPNEKGQQSRGDVNILADRDTPYSVLRKVMRTCAASNFERISLAVNERGGRS